MHRVKECLCAAFLKVCAATAPNEECVSGENCSLATHVIQHKRDASTRVPRCRTNCQLDSTNNNLISVIVQYVSLCACCFGDTRFEVRKQCLQMLHALVQSLVLQQVLQYLVTAPHEQATEA